MKIETALLSVYDKSGLTPFARRLEKLGIALVSTGGTANHLREAGLTVREVSELTGFPEILEGRVKSLHPKVHGGILARPDSSEHERQLADHQIRPIGLVVVNLYPFRETVGHPGVELTEAVEQIDVGGPTLVRAAAKNHRFVTVVVDPSDYPRIEAELRSLHGKTRLGTRLDLARKAFRHTAEYDLAITEYLEGLDGESGHLPPAVTLGLRRVQSLRYGENPHQRGGLYRLSGEHGGVAGATQMHGKPLSFNNLLDLDAAWRLAAEFDRPFCGIIKHTNPCGAAVADIPVEAFERALECDPTSAFGSIVSLNRPVDRATAEAMSRLFVEAVIAPGFEEEALRLLTRKKNLRVMQAGEEPDSDRWAVRGISGGFLLQDVDRYFLKRDQLKVTSRRQPDDREWGDMLFAWRVCKHVKSNAVVLAAGARTVGIGAGQMSRVDSVRIAVEKAQGAGNGGVMASDAFFPFRDGIDVAAEAGVRAVIQPGGSIRDPEVIEAADEHGMTMVLTGVRHFRH